MKIMQKLHLIIHDLVMSGGHQSFLGLLDHDDFVIKGNQEL